MEPISGPSAGPDLNEVRRRALEAPPPPPPPADPAPAEPAPTGHPDASSFQPTPPPPPVALTAPTGPVEGPAGLQRISSANRAYATARTDVDRLNGHLVAALQNPALANDPAAAARFRDEFRREHAGVYEREQQAARDLATAVREVGPNSPRPAVAVMSALHTLSGSSEAQQAIEIAGRLGAGANPVLPQGAAQSIAERASGTLVQRELAAGRTPDETARTTAQVLSGAGFGSTAARLALPAELAARFAGLGVASVAGGLVNAAADFSAFGRTGDATSAVAGGLALTGAAGAGLAAAGVGAPVTVPLAVIGSGALVARELARQNEFQASVSGAMGRALGIPTEAARALAAQPGRVEDLQRLGLNNDQITALATDPNRRHFLTRDSAILMQPYLARATPAERAQLLAGMSNEDVGAASRAATFGPAALRQVSNPEVRALLERLRPPTR